MSTKLQKKRKTPSSPSFHSPSSSSQQAASGQMSQSFNSGGPAPASNGHALNGVLAAYHPALPNFSAFPGLNTFAQSLNGQPQPSLQTPAQQAFFPQISRPHSSGNSDLEKLERLKKEILEGQNPIYKAVPQPNFLESLYLGRSLQAQNSVPAHPEQVAIGSKASTNLQPSPAVRSDGDTKANDLGRSAPVNQAREDAGATSASKAQYSNNSSPSISTAPPSSVVSSIRPDSTNLARSASIPQLMSKTLQADQRPPYPSQMSTQDATKFTYSNGAEDPAKHGHTYSSGQQNTRPTSEKLPVQSTADNHARHSGPPNNSVSSKDPPYDPKESLRRPGDSSYGSDDRSRRIMDNRDSRVFDSRYGRGGDRERDRDIRERDRDRDRERDRDSRDRRYDYRFDDRRIVADDYRDRRISSVSGNDPRDQRPQDLRRHDSRSSDDRMDADSLRPAPSVSDRFIRPADERISRPVPSGERPIRPSASDSPAKPANGSDQARFIPSSTTPGSAVKSQSAGADDRLPRAPPSNAHARPPVDERSRPFEDPARLPSVDDRGRQSSGDDRSRHPSQTTERSAAAPALEERIGGRAPPALEDRIGIRIPLEDRISSPPLNRLARPAPALQERIGDRTLEERMNSRPGSVDSRGPAGGDSLRIGDARSISIPAQSPSTRLRPVDEKVTSSPTTATANARALQQRVEDHSISSSSGITTRSDDRLQLRPSVYSTDSRTPVRESSRSTRPPSPRRNVTASDPLLREKYPEAPDPRLIPAPVYRDDHDRRYTDPRRSDVEAVGHYERPLLREHDPAPVDDRARPNLETREWRERARYPPRTSATRPETYPPLEVDRFAPPPSSDPRDWTPSGRNYRPSEPSWDARRSSPPVVDAERDRYLDRDFDRRSTMPPRSWDRDDVLTCARPPPEVYPPEDRINVDRERFAPADFREPSRIRARSPSPSPTMLRRSAGGGALEDLRPAKRVREESAYYDERRAPLVYSSSEHYAHSRAASPPPTSAGSYFEARATHTPRDVHDAYPERERASELGYYERRVTDMGPPRSPPYTGRAIYSRPDLDREGGRCTLPPPPRTA